MLSYNDNIVAGAPCVFTDNITMSGNGTSSAPLGFKLNNIRYEQIIFSSDTAASAGTFSTPWSSFDYIKLGVGIEDKTNYIDITKYDLSARNIRALNFVDIGEKSTVPNVNFIRWWNFRLITGANNAWTIDQSTWQDFSAQSTTQWYYVNSSIKNIVYEIKGIKYI